MRPTAIFALLLAAVAMSACTQIRAPQVAHRPGAIDVLMSRGQPRVVPVVAPVAAGPVVPVAGAPVAPGAVPLFVEPTYTLDSGERLRIVVYGQEGLTNTYVIGPTGSINMPLIGNVTARGLTTSQLAGVVTSKLRAGFIREPSVSVEIDAYRPFFILGEVTVPGQYAYVPNMTVETAVAIAGGFTPRAFKGDVVVNRVTNGTAVRGPMPLVAPVRPGDTIVVKERWF